VAGDQRIQLGDPGKPVDDPTLAEHHALLVEQAHGRERVAVGSSQRATDGT